MIGSMLFYGLYPLSRYLTGRRSEVSIKDLPTALVNGTAVCDGGAVTASQLTVSEPAPVEELLAPCTGSCGQPEERMSAHGGGDATLGADREHCLTVLPIQKANQEKFEPTAALEDFPKQQNEVNFPDTEVAIKDEDPVPVQIKNEGLSSKVICTDETLCEQFEKLQAENTRETTCSVQPEIPNLKELLASPKSRAEEVTCSGGTHVQSVQESVVTPSECWDEYMAGTDNTSKDSSEARPMCLLYGSQTPDMSLTGPHLTQPGYHFAVGPGLANEVQCPLWQFPTPSYYPTMENTLPFEVMWRVWEDVENSSSASTPALIPFPFTKTVMNFTVMSYNILSQDLLEANQDLYTHCPLEVLEWSHRCRLFLEEIQRWAPDILCLQEVQENHFYQQLHPVLTQMGYTCVYKRRTGTKTDGCATCYRSSSFAELSIIEVEYFRPEIELLDRHNVAIIVLLQPMVAVGSEVKARGPSLCVANTHLLFNPRRGDIKLAQLAILLAEMDKVVKSCKSKGEHCNIVLCGDFNSVPQTPLYELITKGELYYQGLPAWMISGQEDLSFKPQFYKLYAPLWPSTLGITDCCQFTSVNQVLESHKQKAGSRQYHHEFLLQLRFCPAACERPEDLEMIPGVTDATPDCSKDRSRPPRFRQTLSHRLDLQSVYKHVLPGSGNAEVTTVHSQVGATVDYIFYSPKHHSDTEIQEESSFAQSGLKLIGCLSLLSEDVLWSMNGLPSDTFPSDHLSLLAKFQLDMNGSP